MRRALIALLFASAAYADDEPPPAPQPETAPAEPAVPTPADLAERIEQLEERAERVEVLEQRVAELHEEMRRLTPLRRFITVFVDVGWFAVGGDGSGVRRDIGHRYVKDHGGVPAEWVLIGDPLSTTINTLGEPADIGASRSIDDDTVDSDGNPSFILNTLGLSVGRSLGHGIAVSGLVELLPRTGPDILAVEYAKVDYRPTKKMNLVLSAGKVDSVLGIEYRAQEAPDRLGITPSLLCRYICGRPFGVRAHLDHKGWDVSALLSSGDTFQERFERDPRIASTKLPTAAAHLQYLVPIGSGIKVGASGSFGPQDGQTKTRVHQWHYGFDLRIRDKAFELQAEFVQGKQQGSSTGLANMLEAMPDPTVVAPRCSFAQCLRYKAAYGTASYRAAKWFTPYARVDWRDARHQYGVDFLYVSRVVRGTVGAQFSMTNRILGKVEYTYNHELLGPQFPNDVLTTSIVVATE